MLNLQMVVLGAALTPVLLGQQYKLTPLFSPVDGRIYAEAINNQGTIVGSIYPEPPAPVEPYGFIRYPDGRMLYPIKVDSAIAGALLTGINNVGDVVGTGMFSSRVSVLWAFRITAAGQYTRFTYPGAATSSTTAGEANTNGDFVGYLSDAPDEHGFVTVDGVPEAVGFPEARKTEPQGLAWDGTVVGCYTRGNRKHAFLRGPKGTYLGLRVPNARETCALSINNVAGKITGYFRDDTNVTHGFVYDYRTDVAALETNFLTALRTVPVQVIDYPGAVTTHVTSINAKGVIVGSAQPPNGHTFSFVGTPIP